MTFPELKGLDSTATDERCFRLLYAFIEFLQPRIIVEAGTYMGHFAAVAKAAWPKATVLSADPSAKVRPEHEDLEGVTFYSGDFSDMLAEHEPEVDFAFIDSGPPCPDGKEPGIRFRHFQSVQPYMNDCGVIAVHDTNIDKWVGAKDIRKSGVVFMGGRGITVVQP